MESSKIGVVIVLCAFLTFPLIIEALDPSDQYLNTAEPTAAFPSPIRLWKQITVKGTEPTTNVSETLDTTEVIPTPTTNVSETLDTTEVVAAPRAIVYENAPVFPKWLNPMKGMVVHPLDWPAPSCIELNTGKNNLTILDVSLPSVYCLQSSSDFAKLSGNCKEAAESWGSFMANIFPVGYTNFLSNDNTKKLFPTLNSYFAGFDESVKSLTNDNNGIPLSIYQLALTHAVPYINLPLIAHYLKLDTEVVWLTFHSDDPLNPIMRSDRPQNIDEKTIILPLVNPRCWHLPVDKDNPYSVLIPNLQADDPYANETEALRSILHPGTNFINNFEKNWKPLEHETRGLLFLNVLLRVEAGMAYGDIDDSMLEDLVVFLKTYEAAIQLLAFYNHVPSSYVVDEALKITSNASQADGAEIR